MTTMTVTIGEKEFTLQHWQVEEILHELLPIGDVFYHGMAQIPGFIGGTEITLMPRVSYWQAMNDDGEEVMLRVGVRIPKTFYTHPTKTFARFENGHAVTEIRMDKLQEQVEKAKESEL